MRTVFLPAVPPRRAALAAAFLLAAPWLPLPGGPAAAARAQSRPLTAAVPAVDTADRRAVVAAYRASYLPDQDVLARWTGSVEAGESGTVAPEFLAATLRRINFYRALVSLPNVAFDAELSRRSQAAALLMCANQALSHAPPPSWRWWSAEAAAAAANCNLAADDYSQEGPSAIDAYLADDGPSNYGVGHRRWVLFPPQQTMGSGSVPAGTAGPGSMGANALWIGGPYADDASGTTAPAAVAWPPAGYLPATLLPRRWSLSVVGADFRAAAVTVSRNGAAVPVSLEALKPDPVREPDAYVGLPTIVWVPQTAAPNTDVEETWTVRVEGVRVGGVLQSAYAYTVTTLPEAVTAPPTLTLTVPVPTTSFGGLAGAVELRRGGDGDLSDDLAVRYAVGGAAVGGRDYQVLSGVALIPAGATTVRVTVVPLAGGGAGKVKLRMLADCAYRVGDPAVVKVKIVAAPVP